MDLQIRFQERNSIQLDLYFARYRIKENDAWGQWKKLLNRGMRVPLKNGVTFIVTTIELKRGKKSLGWLVLPTLRKEELQFMPRNHRHTVETSGVTPELLNRKWYLAKISVGAQSIIAVCQTRRPRKGIKLQKRPPVCIFQEKSKAKRSKFRLAQPLWSSCPAKPSR